MKRQNESAAEHGSVIGALAVALAMSVLCSVGNAQPADQQPLGSSLGNCVRLRVPLPITEQA